MRLLLLLIFCMLFYFSYAQPTEYTVSYFGKQVTRPGVKASITVCEEVLGHSSARKIISVSPSLGGYWHYRNHVGLFVNTEISFSILYRNNLMWEVYTGAGYLRTILNGKVYTVYDNLDVKQLFLAGNNQFMPTVGIGFGKKYQEESPLKKSFIRTGVFFQYPHNTMWLLSPYLEIGIGFGPVKK